VTPAFPIPDAAIADFCRRWHVDELALFGSVTRPDFRPDSDVDVLVTFSHDAHPTLLDLAAMERELESVFGRPVDLLERRGVEQMRNPYLRREILATAEVIHA
jgi:predicted nucleotidyltransferase